MIILIDKTPLASFWVLWNGCVLSAVVQGERIRAVLTHATGVHRLQQEIGSNHYEHKRAEQKHRSGQQRSVRVQLEIGYSQSRTEKKIEYNRK